MNMYPLWLIVVLEVSMLEILPWLSLSLESLQPSVDPVAVGGGLEPPVRNVSLTAVVTCSLCIE